MHLEMLSSAKMGGRVLVLKRFFQSLTNVGHQKEQLTICICAQYVHISFLYSPPLLSCTCCKPRPRNMEPSLETQLSTFTLLPVCTLAVLNRSMKTSLEWPGGYLNGGSPRAASSHCKIPFGFRSWIRWSSTGTGSLARIAPTTNRMWTMSKVASRSEGGGVLKSQMANSRLSGNV